MRIAYIAQIDAHRENGVTKKIREQITEWRRCGNDVALFVMARTPGRWDGWGDISVRLHTHHGGWSRMSAASAVVRHALEWRPDIVYFRMGPCYPAFMRLVAQVPTVVEQNTADIEEARLGFGAIKLLYHRHSQDMLLRRVSGVVAVCGEVAERVRRSTRPVLIQGNGISLSACAPLPAANNAGPRLVFIGTRGAVWHGIDKVIDLATHFPRWQFDIVGDVKQLVSEVPDNVALHGYQTSDQYDRLLATADVAIGTLALYRKRMREASPLKTREYLAKGLPTIIAYDDTDFPSPVPYLLQLPNTEDNIAANLDRIEHFVESWKGRRVPQHAIAHLDVREKELQRIAFFCRLVATKEPSRVP
jgi:hypothetical protein